MMTQTRFENEAEKAVVLIFFFEPVAGELCLFTLPWSRPKEGKKSKKKRGGGLFSPRQTRERKRDKKTKEERIKKKLRHKNAPQKALASRRED